jgi:ABC-2 type transport system permease protein
VTPTGFPQPRAILWAQWRTMVNFQSRATGLKGRWGSIVTLLLTLFWYAMWILGAFIVAERLQAMRDFDSGRNAMSYGLIMGFFYWQVVPLMLATAGASLEVKKLVVYPIPHSQLFLLDVLMRVSTGLEVLIMLVGASIGIALNPKLPWWAPLAFLPYIVFNLALASGVRELISRALARPVLREIVIFLFVLIGAVPQLYVFAGDSIHLPPLQSVAFLKALQHGLSNILPWTATAQWSMARPGVLAGVAVLLGWTIVAWLFGRWQFERSLVFDSAAANAPRSLDAPPSRWAERLFSWPSRVFPDPLAAMIEKELRSLSRTPRFRLVFVMGFSFGILLWVPMLMRSSQKGFFRENYLTFVAVYALLLLGEVCLWNIFGFDRAAAQAYLVTPISLRGAFLAKNLTALMVVLAEVTLVALVCKAVRQPLSLAKAVPAYLICIIMTFALMAAGNLTSVYYARPINPMRTMRTTPAARTQGMLMLIYTLALGLIGFAYLAEWAFESVLAFYAVLAILGLVTFIAYRVSLDSAVAAALANREQFITALSSSETPVVT